jgi:integrase
MTLIRRGKYFHYAFQMDGRRYRGSTKESVKAKAAQFEQVLMARIREGGAHAAPKRPITLAAWAELFLDHCSELVAAGKLDLDTELYYRHGWQLLSTTKLADYRLQNIATEDADVLRFPGSPSNVNCALRTLRRLLNAAADRGRLLKAPKVHLVEETGREQLVEPWMEELLLRHAEQPLHNILIDIFDSGRRPEEVMRTRRSDLLWDRDRVKVEKSKTSKDSGTRYVPFTDRMKQIHAAHKDKEDGWLYPSKRAKCGHRTTISKQWAQCVKAANRERAENNLAALPAKLVPYCGRHTLATDLLNDSKNIKLVQKTLGHADIRTTMKYLHPDEAEAVEVINARNRRRNIRLVEKTG